MKNLKNNIHSHCKKIGMEFDNKGYVKHPEFNLIEKFDNWIEIKNELEDGQGGELKPDKNRIIKFCAVHSSAALCVNNFSLFKKNIEKFTFNNYSNFKDSSFEKKLPTGISTSNLDFYLESPTTIIGFESKYTEYFTAKSPNINLEKYKTTKVLNYLPKDFTLLLDKYINIQEKFFLDTAQLIKHSIGLINRNEMKKKFVSNKIDDKPVLVYIYWEPKNNNDKLFKKHKNEIESFKKDIDKFVTFISMTYSDLWEMYENNELYKNQFSKVRNRYDITI